VIEFLYTLLVTHITIISVTVFLHRSQAHKSLDLSQSINHFFRFWLWMTSGINTKEWVAIHRKHHVFCDTEKDPHSPKIEGVLNILFKGLKYYRKEAKNKETLERYGKNTPNDWVEINVYSKFPNVGLLLMIFIDVWLFGLSGLIVFLVQVIWIPFWAAGVINGIGHFFGYRNSRTDDVSTNIIPWGMIVGGEELHNNHHAYPYSAKLSLKWYEFDIGWMYIRLFEMVGLARVNRIAILPPKEEINLWGVSPNLANIYLQHKFYFMQKFNKSILAVVIKEVNWVKDNIGQNVRLNELKDIFYKDKSELTERQSKLLSIMLGLSTTLNKLYLFKEEFIHIMKNKLESNSRIDELKSWYGKFKNDFSHIEIDVFECATI